MTDVFSQPDDFGELKSSELHSSVGESLGASAGQAFMGGVRGLGRQFQYASAEGIAAMTSDAATLNPATQEWLEKQRAGIPEVPMADAQAHVKQEGLEGHFKLPDQPTIKKPVLDLMVQHAHERQQYEAAVSRGPQNFGMSALSFVTEMGVGIIDPVNIAAFSIPVVGEARYGMMMKSAGESLLKRAGVKAGVGAAQGTVGGAALVPGDWWLHTQDGVDYTMADALHSVVMSAGMGGAFHALPGLYGDVRARIAGQPLHPAEILADLPPRAQEDVVRMATADVINGNAVRVGEVLNEAAKEDKRIAESVNGRPAPVEAAPVQQPEPGKIDATHDVVSGANSSRDPNGPVFIDKHIPEFSPILKDQSGQPANLHKYLAIHERKEAEAMAKGMSYDEAHTKVATAAERQAVEADGVDWKEYTHEMDGYLAKVEHEKPTNPVAKGDLHVDPNKADADHHHSSNKLHGHEAVFAEAHGMLSKAGVPDADVHASVVAARYTTRAARLGKSAIDMYRGEGLEVRRGEAGQAVGRSFDQGSAAKLVQDTYNEIKAEQRNIGTVYIGDIIARTGLSKEEVHDVILEASRSGRAGINASSEPFASLPPGRREGAIAFDKDEIYHTVTLKPDRSFNQGTKPPLVQLLDRNMALSDLKVEAERLSEQPRSFNQSMPAFFSAISRVVDDVKQEKAPAAQWLGMLKNKPGVKPEEMEWLGLEGWLKEQKGTVTKTQIQDYIRANNIKIDEVEKGHPSLLADFERRMTEKYGDLWMIDNKLNEEEKTERISIAEREGFVKDRVKFGPDAHPNLSLPGGKNYRELLLTLPERADPSQNFRSTHWSELNTIAHIRFNDREIDGKRTLFIEEIQSDWHQAGKKRGYKEGSQPTEKERAAEHAAIFMEARRREPSLSVSEAITRHDDLSNRWAALEAAGRQAQFGVPDAPFKTTWPELSLKRMIRYAAENDYEQVAWTPGKVQAERYDLSKQVESIDYTRKGTQTALNIFTKPNGERIGKVAKTDAELADLVGKEIADKIIKSEGLSNSAPEHNVTQGTLSNIDLQVGGEGMKGFYDEILPATANKLTKKYGARVGKAEIDKAPHKGPIPEGSYDFSRMQEVHTLPLTPELKQAAMGGFPLFQRGNDNIANAKGRITLGSNKAIIDMFAGADHSTMMHEMGHLWLDELTRDAETKGVPQALKDDLGTVLRWLGVTKSEDIGVAQHEQWARGFEQYLMEGKAPSNALTRAFAQFKDWLTQIYRSLKNLGVPITDDIRGVMDRMLATDEQIAQRRGQEKADWQKVADAKRGPDDDLTGASIAAEKAKEPESIDTTKSLTAAEKAAAETDQLLKDILPTLSEAERKQFEDALSAMDQEKADNEKIVKEGFACLMGAIA